MTKPLLALSFSLALAACSTSPSSSTTTATTGTTAGSTGASTTGGTTGAASTSTTRSTSGATTGTHGTTGTSSATGTTSSTSTSSGGSTSGVMCATELTACTSSSICACGMQCVTDTAYLSQNPFAGGDKVCERPCHSDLDCPNPATVCTVQAALPVFDGGVDAGLDGGGLDAGADAGTDDGGSDAGADAGTDDGGLDAGADAGPVGVCAIAVCGRTSAGQPCSAPLVDADAGTIASGVGTCIPQSGIQPDGTNTLLLCLPNGSASSCSLATDENPLLSSSTGFFGGLGAHLLIPTTQSRLPSTLCAAGTACLDGGCATLCATSADCDAGTGLLCVAKDPNDLSWGFCLPCGASVSDGGTAATCVQNADCCEKNCVMGGITATGTCNP